MNQESFDTNSCGHFNRIDQKNRLEIDPILKLPEVLKVTSLKKTALYKMMEAGLFPRQIKLGARRVGWRQSAIREWINSRPYVDELSRGRDIK